ncbi:Cro/CI family transcriptional regulator [Ectopseudomonas mendocina]|uniref:Cro/CI family transcriptional regulator n=1 Tax=Ectopseudomonas mendocina TaxID=300 RepID=A0ABZ2RAJ8_ECTME
MSTHFEKLVSHFGSQQATAEALGVKQGTVSGWVRGLHGCTAEVAMRAEIITSGAVKARDLRPSIPQAVA